MSAPAAAGPRLPADLEVPLRTVVETAGGVTLRVECLDDLDATIDTILRWLERTGQADRVQAASLCPYFGVVWSGARALVERVAALPEAEVRGRRWLEVGCGLALPSLALALRGARVVATDCHPEVPRFLDRNLALNGLGPDAVTYVHADWLEEGAPAPPGGPFDRILGSDLLYERAHAPALAAFLDRVVPPGGEVVVVDPGRRHLQLFIDGMVERGFRCADEVKTVDAGLGGKTQDVFVLTFAR